MKECYQPVLAFDWVRVQEFFLIPYLHRSLYSIIYRTLQVRTRILISIFYNLINKNIRLEKHLFLNLLN